MIRLTPAQRVSRHREFLNANWTRIASFAYSGFRDKGRGVVAVPEADFVQAARPELTPVHFRYFTEADIREVMTDYDDSNEEGWVASYNPEEKVIVTVIRYDGTGVSSYLIGSRPSPLEAYRLEKVKGN